MILHFDLEPCCSPWVHVRSWKTGESVSRALVACGGCGQRRVITVTSVAERKPEETRLRNVVVA